MKFDFKGCIHPARLSDPKGLIASFAGPGTKPSDQVADYLKEICEGLAESGVRTFLANDEPGFSQAGLHTADRIARFADIDIRTGCNDHREMVRKSDIIVALLHTGNYPGDRHTTDMLRYAERMQKVVLAIEYDPSHKTPPHMRLA